MITEAAQQVGLTANDPLFVSVVNAIRTQAPLPKGITIGETGTRGTATETYIKSRSGDTKNGSIFFDENGTSWKIVGVPLSASSQRGAPKIYQIKRMATGGLITNYDSGGPIKGIGTKKSDSNLIRASLGEYMFSAPAVDNLGGPAIVDFLHKAAKENKLGNFLHKLLFGTGNLPKGTLKNEIPFGPGNIAKGLYKIPNTISGILNYFKARNLVKAGMFHGSAATGLHGEDFLQGKNIIDSAIARDKHYGMGFYGTSSKAEANLYATGYNTSTEGSAYGALNKITKIPFGKYIDFRKPLKWQDYALYKELQKVTNLNDYKYFGEQLGPTMKKLGLSGSIMPQITSGRMPKEFYATWLSWANPKNIHTQSLAEGGYIGKLHSWNGEVPGPYGKEVNATLRAGTEGVYQKDYINSLQKDATSTSNSNTVYNVTMTVSGVQDPQKAADLVIQKLSLLNNKNNKSNKVTF